MRTSRRYTEMISLARIGNKRNVEYTGSVLRGYVYAVSSLSGATAIGPSASLLRSVRPLFM